MVVRAYAKNLTNLLAPFAKPKENVFPGFVDGMVVRAYAKNLINLLALFVNQILENVLPGWYVDMMVAHMYAKYLTRLDLFAYSMKNVLPGFADGMVVEMYAKNLINLLAPFADTIKNVHLMLVSIVVVLNTATRVFRRIFSKIHRQ